MILDSQEVLSDAQAVTSTAISTNVLDLNPDGSANAIQDVGNGEPVYLVVQTQTAATDSGSDATLTVTLESDTDPALATTPVVHFSSGALAFSAFSPAGSRLVAIRLPSANYQRYIGVRYTVASGPLTAGKFDAFIAKDINAVKAYASGFSVG